MLLLLLLLLLLHLSLSLQFLSAAARFDSDNDVDERSPTAAKSLNIFLPLTATVGVCAVSAVAATGNCGHSVVSS
jgi:hypothetical protein